MFRTMLSNIMEAIQWTNLSFCYMLHEGLCLFYLSMACNTDRISRTGRTNILRHSMLGLPSPETQLPQPGASVSTRENTHQISFYQCYCLTIYKATAKTPRSEICGNTWTWIGQTCSPFKCSAPEASTHLETSGKLMKTQTLYYIKFKNLFCQVSICYWI